ncbi:MAG: Trx7/PDZ domain-containing (seleno)protein [Candidatus Poribacteria bacterium]|nr:Trx7/PDZ domain-containing (seleno)protein [Candidatus Poribacteria bacterium]
MACKGFDEQVVRHDPEIQELMEQFVRVRIVQTNGMDLSLFQFDFDLTFAAFFMNADKTIYGRYGSRSDQKDPMRDISIEGFGKALAAALAIHQEYPANKAALRGKKGHSSQFTVPEAYPSLSKYKPKLDYSGNVAKGCIHCHMIGAAERQIFRNDHKPIPDEVLYLWPMPDVIGLTLNPHEKATVVRVANGSPAEKAGFLPGDEILTLEGQPIISIADVQWVLHTARTPTTLQAAVRRDRQPINVSLSLSRNWRRQGEISWRTTTWDLRRMALGGLVLEALTGADRRSAELEDTEMALRVKHVGQYGDHAAGKKAGFQKGDILVSFDAQTNFMTETELIVYALQNKMPSVRVPVTVLRAGEQVNLELPMQ